MQGKYSLKKQCKAIVKHTDGRPAHRCHLGVWQTNPQEGLCFMHHPKAKTKRGAAALNRILRGEADPVTRKARAAHARRLAGEQPYGNDAKKNDAKKNDTRKPETTDEPSAYRVCFVQHILSVSHGAASRKQCVGFDLRREARAYAAILKRRGDNNPIWSEDQSGFSFFSNVEIQ